MEARQTITVKLDKTPPVVVVGVADGEWHGNDVLISGTARDDVSDLAEPDDARFTLSTRVEEGTETDDASTDSRTIVDIAGNSTTAGTIRGNKVDKKAPEITINSPQDNAVCLLNEAVAAQYTGHDGGSGLASLVGTVPSGSAVDTRSVGTKSFSVTATDGVGNASEMNVLYRVSYGVRLLKDPADKPKKSGNVNIQLQLVDASGANVSFPGVAVTAQKLTRLPATQVPLADTAFMYDAALGGPCGGYIYKRKGLVPGSYELVFMAGADSISHSISFQVL